MNMKDQKRVLVSGAGGFIGRHLVSYLAERGYWVRGVDIERRYDLTKPQGVSSRNSGNDRLRKVLGWEPQTTPEQGLESTYHWIAAELGNASERSKAA